MGVLDDLQGQVVGLDTAPLIYFIEKHATYHPVVKPLFTALAGGRFTAVTSTITLVETLIHPLSFQQTALANRYRDILLNAQHLTTYDLSPTLAAKAAEIRASFGFRTPDAIQLATAVSNDATFFLTNDHNLLKFTQLQVLTIDALL